MRQLENLVAPGQVAVLTMELQRGIVGDLSCLPRLAKSVAEAGVLANTARVLEAARGCGIPVIHCTAAFRPDRAGSFDNVPLVNQLLRNPEHLLIGSAEVEICPELRPAPSDLESQRLHGISPFHGTSLDPILRS
ncbi:MAG: cysteine hydrolase family protein, partial [Myxococcota bacterium]